MCNSTAAEEEIPTEMPLTEKMSTASARVRPLAALPPLPWRICHSKLGLLGSACSSTLPCRCRLSKNLLMTLSNSDSGPFATNNASMLLIALQSCLQNHSPCGSSCKIKGNAYPPPTLIPCIRCVIPLLDMTWNTRKNRRE
jgi:hypothetical protein